MPVVPSLREPISIRSVFAKALFIGSLIYGSPYAFLYSFINISFILVCKVYDYIPVL